MIQMFKRILFIQGFLVFFLLGQSCKTYDDAKQSSRSEKTNKNNAMSDGRPFNQNEPEGFKLITERSFTSYGEGWVENSGDFFTIIQDAKAPRSPRNVGRITYPLAFEGGYEPAKTGFQDFSVKSIYASFSVKHSANWQGHSSSVNKVFYITDSSVGGNGDPAYVLLNGASSSFFFQIHKQGPTGALNFSQNVRSIYITPGEWMNVEVLLVMNSEPDTSDGEAHLWVNGEKTIEDTSVQWSDGDRTWDSIRWEPIWGGVYDAVIEQMTMDMDHIYVSGK